MGDIQSLRWMIESAERTVFFGGAGVSTESGIPDFRSAQGIFGGTQEKYPAEEILHINFFASRPEHFFEFYRSKLIYESAQPNGAHLKLAELETAGKLEAVVTQNIDGLHQAAGSVNVIEMHGSIHNNYCIDCRETYPLSHITSSTGVPKCGCGGIVRPDVTLYGEELSSMAQQKAVTHIKQADLLIVAGTSLQVYPVAGFLRYFRGRRLVVINKTGTWLDEKADLVIREPVGETLEKL